MAVIESKGDGYALYNGVKLPSLPEYDTEKYPYILITDVGTMYMAVASTEPFTYGSVTTEVYGLSASTDGLRSLWRCEDKSAWSLVFEGKNSYNKIVIGDVASPSMSVLVWSNYDIINPTDGSVYFATSEPIPLDGMNVIEWDGDTQGLEPFPRGSDFLFVSDTTDVDTNKEWIGVITFRDGAGSVVRRGTPSERDGCWVRTLVASYVPTATADSPTAGLYIYGTDLRYVSLFAYYPIETGGDEEPAETVSYIKFLCSPSFYYLPKNVFGWKLAQKRGGGFPVTPPINVLITLDGYILQDKNGLYIIPKED